MTRPVRFASLAIAVALVAFTISRLHLDATRHALAGMSWRWAVVAAIINLLGIIIDGSRWRIVLSALARVPLSSACLALLAGIIGNTIFPFKLGEGARAYMMARREQLPVASTLATVLVDRALDAAALPLFVALASLVFPLPSAVLHLRRWAMVLVIAMVGAALVIAREVRRRQASRSDPLAEARNRIDRIIAGLAVFGHRRRIAAAAVIAILAWLPRAAIVWCMLHAFHLRLPLAAAVSVLALINLGIAAVATPGNVGTFEVSTAAALALWGVIPETGVSLGIAMHAVEVLPPLALGLATVGWLAPYKFKG
jgi:hypothetical protein